ncbi:glucose/galactose MFS transporter [Parapedobacter defluvii]|uniref:Glucose/galactose MFS transporter n=1 Tax=Parapedobacter defluvii TaxID=2045106 RepID=A0ABQ1LTG9_9SPHI|nr:sugar MFS transporter [Parapedobacter defluvii]GGC27410.1 glucose/galactose MFS transporter [Parapedobacter defluvii]
MKRFIQPLIIIGALFFILGFITWLSSVLIPYLQIACELNNFQSYLVAFAFYISYFVMAVPSGWLLKFTGFKKGMSIGLLAVAAGSLIFVPAAIYRSYPVFLFGLFIQGAGLAILQTASNPYVTILGPIDSAARRISIMGICNGIAGILAPAILGAVVLDNADNIKDQLLSLTDSEKAVVLNELAGKVIVPYLVITGMLLLLSLWVYRSGLPEIDESALETETDGTDIGEKASVFQFPQLLFGVLTLFVYTGVEVIAGNTIISYGAFLGIPLSTAKFFTSFTLVGMLIGYLIGIVCIPRFVSQRDALKCSAGLGILFGLSALFTEGVTSVVFIALLGLANSLIWPSVWPLAIDGLGKFTKIGSSLLVMAISGAAVIPLFYGWLADRLDAQQAYWLVIPCYLIVGWYAAFGYRFGAKMKGVHRS